MSHQERSNAISLFTTLTVSLPYIFFVLNKYQNENPQGSDLLAFWANAVLLLIPLRIVIEIIAHILVSIFRTAITKQSENMKTDERDHLIELKGTRNSYYVFMIGMLAAMISLAVDKSVSTMFIVLLIAGFLSEIFGILSQIYYYRKGI